MPTDQPHDETLDMQLARLRGMASLARRRRARFVPQHHEMDCAAACLETVVQCYGRRAGLTRCRDVVRDGREGASLRDLQLGAERLGFECVGLRIDFETDLAALPLPIIVGMDQHFVVVHRIRGGRAELMDPALGPTTASLRTVTKKTGGICLVLVPTKAFWAWPEVKPDRGRYLRLVRDHWLLLAAAFVCSLFLLALGAIGPWLSQRLFDEVMPLGDEHLLEWIAAGYLGVVVFSRAAHLGRQWILSELAFRIDRYLGLALYDRFFEMPLTEFQRRTPGDVTGALDEVSAIRSFLTGEAMQTVLEVGNLLVYLILLWTLAPKLVVLALLVAPLYAVIPLLVGPAVRRARAIQVQRSSRLETLILEQVAGIRTLKALGAESHARQAYGGRLDDFLGQMRRGQRTILPLRSATEAFESLVSVGTLLLSVHWVVAGELSVGEMVAGTLLVSQFLRPVAGLAERAVELQEVRLSLDRVEDAFAQAPEPEGGSSAKPVAGDVCFTDVSYRFTPGARFVLDGLNATFREGELTAIVGRSGSGKTTLAHLVTRLVEPEAGVVCIGGVDVREFPRARLRRETGVGLSEHPLFQGTVLENIALGTEGPPSEARAREACEAAQIAEFVDQLPSGYASRIPESGMGLSSGQKQRLAVARLFYRDSRVLVLDEVTSYLDASAEAALLENLVRRKEGKTIIFITHRPSIVRFADRLLVLKDGRFTDDLPLGSGPGRESRESAALRCFETL